MFTHQRATTFSPNHFNMINVTEGNFELIKHSENTQKILRKHSENTQRAPREHSEITQRSLRDSEITQSTFVPV